MKAEDRVLGFMSKIKLHKKLSLVNKEIDKTKPEKFDKRPGLSQRKITKLRLKRLIRTASYYSVIRPKEMEIHVQNEDCPIRE